MRVLVEATGEVGQRTAQVLLSQASVDYVGILRSTNPKRSKRSGSASGPEGYDIAVTDSPGSPSNLIAQCAVTGIPVVVWADATDVAPGKAVIPIVLAANAGSALPGALLSHPTASLHDDDPVTVAWTEPGKPKRRGETVVFPEPVGRAVARQRSAGELVATVDGDWAAVVAHIGSDDDRRIVGVADHAAYLEALVLGAVVLAAAAGAYPPGVHRAGDAGEHLLNALDQVELDIATWRSTV